MGKLGNGTLFLALLLSFIQSPQACATQNDISGYVLTPAALTQATISEQVGVVERILATRQNIDGNEKDPISGLQPVPFQYSAPVTALSRLHGLPMPSGPPGSSTSHSFQARAPPVA